MTDFVINVIVDPAKATKGIKRVNDGLTKTEKQAKQLQRTLGRAFAFIGILTIVRNVGQLIDVFTNAQNRIRLVTKGVDQLNAVMSELFDISNRTRTSFEATSTIFSRTALAVANLGLSQRQTLNFTESLNQAIVLSGVKAQEANAGLIQLSQGLASGTLRGDELRSVLEQLPKVADVIAKEMGVTRGELRLLGQEGKISAENVITAFANAADELRDQFATSIPTISQAFSVLVTETSRFISEVDKSTSASETLSRGVILLASNLDTVAKFAIIAGAALAGPFARAGVLFATRAVVALSVAIAANPIGAIIIAVSAAIAAMIQFGDQLTVSADSVLTLKDVIDGTFQFIMDSIQPVLNSLTEGFTIAINFITEALGSINITFENVIGFAKTFINTFIGLHVGLAKAMESIFNDVREIIVSVVGDDLIKGLGIGIENIINFILSGFKVIRDFATSILQVLGAVTDGLGQAIDNLEIPDVDTTFAGNLARVGINAKKAFLEGFGQDFVGDLVAIVAPGLITIEDNARAIAARRTTPTTPGGNLDERGVRSDALPFALREQLRLLDAEAKTLRLANRERGIQNELLKIEEKLRASNTTLTASQRDLLEERIRSITAIREQVEVLDELRSPQEEMKTRQDSLNILFSQGAINLAELNDQMLQLGIAQSALNIEQGRGSFVDGFIVGIEQMLESVRNFGAEAGQTFASFFESTISGFADVTADAIVFGDSFTDALGDAARQALASLLSGLIKIGLQYVLNAALAQTISTGITAVAVAQGATVAAAWAPAAAFTSLASFGANAAPAQVGIASTVALSTALAAIPGFADGGLVTGAGGPRTDSILAALSNGEFVVNAKAAARFRPQLEAMNSAAPTQGSGTNGGTPASNQQSAPIDGRENGNSVRIINVFNPSLVGDFLTSSSGEKVLVNVIERNASAIKQILGST